LIDSVRATVAHQGQDPQARLRTKDHNFILEDSSLDGNCSVIEWMPPYKWNQKIVTLLPVLLLVEDNCAVPTLKHLLDM